jgi:YHS domain-containing protein
LGRIIILAILVYIVYRLLFGGNKPIFAWKMRGKKQSLDSRMSDTLEEDPICKRLVPSRHAVQLMWRGEKRFFCSQECLNIFRSKQGDNKA